MQDIDSSTDEIMNALANPRSGRACDRMGIAGCRVSSEQYEARLKRTHPGDHYFWMDVSAYDVANFFEGYETSKTATRANSKYMADYVRAMNVDGLGGVKNWTDAKDRIAEDTSINSFIAGFGLAWKLSIELNHYENERSVSRRTAMGLDACFASKEEEK